MKFSCLLSDILFEYRIQLQHLANNKDAIYRFFRCVCVWNTDLNIWNGSFISICIVLEIA